MADIIKHIRTDFGRYQYWTLIDLDGEVYDLTGMTAKIFFNLGDEFKFSKDLVIDDPETGIVKFMVTEDDYDEVGEYIGQIVAYEGSTAKQSFKGVIVDVEETLEPEE